MLFVMVKSLLGVGAGSSGPPPATMHQPRSLSWSVSLPPLHLARQSSTCHSCETRTAIPSRLISIEAAAGLVPAAANPDSLPVTAADAARGHNEVDGADVSGLSEDSRRSLLSFLG